VLYQSMNIRFSWFILFSKCRKTFLCHKWSNV